MRYGNWVPLSKMLVSKLPVDREFSELEAMFSLTVDYDNQNPVTVAGLAYLWGWGRKRVRAFLDRSGVALTYSSDTKKMQNQKAQITHRSGTDKGTDNEQIRFIDSKDIQSARNRSGTDKKQIRNRPGNTTIYPNPKPDPDKRKKAKKDDTFDVFAYRPDWVSEEDWNDLVSHRRKHPKKPVESERAYKKLVNELEKAKAKGFTIAECVDEITSRSWAGFLVDWMGEKKTPPLSQDCFKCTYRINGYCKNDKENCKSFKRNEQ